MDISLLFEFVLTSLVDILSIEFKIGNTTIPISAFLACMVLMGVIVRALISHK